MNSDSPPEYPIKHIAGLDNILANILRRLTYATNKIVAIINTQAQSHAKNLFVSRQDNSQKYVIFLNLYKVNI